MIVFSHVLFEKLHVIAEDGYLTIDANLGVAWYTWDRLAGGGQSAYMREVFVGNHRTNPNWVEL